MGGVGARRRHTGPVLAALSLWLLAAQAFAQDAPTRAPDQPMTVLLTSHAPCSGEGGGDIEARVRADRKHALRALEPRLRWIRGTASAPAGEELRRTLRQTAAECAQAGGRCPWARGLVVLYSGHGVSTPESATGGPRSQLCVDGQFLDVEELTKEVEALSPSPPWQVWVLNACESAFVDISHRTLPTAVLSASPSPVTVHLLAEQGASADLAPTPFVDGALRALAQAGADSDRNGIVSTRELLHQVRSAVHAAGGGASPRLQLQSPADLPVAFVPWSGARESQLLELLDNVEEERQVELGCALRKQLCLARPALAARLCGSRCADGDGMPSLAWDAVQTDDRHLARCLSDPQRARRGSTCPVTHNLRLAPAGLSESALADLARISLFHDLYQVVFVDGWVDIRRMRDGRLMATTRAPFALEAVPRRWTAFGSRARPRRHRVTGVLSKRAAAQGRVLSAAAYESRRFVVCEENEGQCFFTAPSSQH